MQFNFQVGNSSEDHSFGWWKNQNFWATSIHVPFKNCAEPYTELTLSSEAVFYFVVYINFGGILLASLEIVWLFFCVLQTEYVHSFFLITSEKKIKFKSKLNHRFNRTANNNKKQWKVFFSFHFGKFILIYMSREKVSNTLCALCKIHTLF